MFLVLWVRGYLVAEFLLLTTKLIKLIIRLLALDVLNSLTFVEAAPIARPLL